MGWFNLYLDLNFERIQDPKKEIQKFYCNSKYGKIGDGYQEQAR
jgi:hypothetical protein